MPGAEDLNLLRSRLDTYMASRGLRSTEQRRLIIDTLFEVHEHLTIDALLEKVRLAAPRVGYATVYRTMKMLAEGDIVHERKFDDGHTRYELAHQGGHHDHLICVSCRAITEFEEPRIEELQDAVAARHGFLVQRHKHELYGVCAACQKKKKTPRGGE